MKHPQLLVAAALVLEFASGYRLLEPASNATLLLLYMLHVIATMLFAVACAGLLPAALREHRSQAILLIGIPVLLLPVAGMLGIALGVVPALHRQRPPDADPPWKLIDDWRLPKRATEYNPDRGVRWAMGLSGSLQNSEDPTRRAAALIGTLSLRDELAVSMLRRALKDPEDEVRLLAYALLNRKEKAIEQRIADYEAKLSTSGPTHHPHLLKAMANAYWQLAQLGTPRGSTQTALLAMAHELAELALQHTPDDGGLHFLLAQIRLAECDPRAAATELVLARAYGVDPHKVSQQQAEVAFQNGHYAAVKSHLKSAGVQRSLTNLGNVSDFWIREERAQSAS